MPSYFSRYTSGSTTGSYTYLFQPVTLHGDYTNNTLYGRYGNDSLYGHDGYDTLIGNAGNDWLDGGNGNDFLHGGTGNDTLSGGADTDVLYGEQGRDQMWGGDGFDILWGGTEQDYLFGGAGTDAFGFNYGDSFAFSGSADIIWDWDAQDIIQGPEGNYSAFGANVTRIEDAAWYANTYQSYGWLPADTNSVFVYNSQTDTGYFLMDLDNDVNNTFESGVILVGAGNYSDVDEAHLI
jgi:Ca2+-binding RTX toxin-like protein